LDGTYPTAKVTPKSALNGSARRTQTDEIKHSSSPFRRTLRRMMPYTGCVEKQDIEEKETKRAGCRGIEVTRFRTLNLGDNTAEK
jgi:hypothetical protein